MDVQSPRWIRYSAYRLLGYFLIGVAINQVARRLILFVPHTQGKTIAISFLILAVIMSIFLNPKAVVRRRAATLRWQRVTAEGEPDTSAPTGHNRFGNWYLVVVNVALLSAVTALAVNDARTAHSKLCLPGAGGAVPTVQGTSLDGAFISTPAGYSELPPSLPGLGSRTAESFTTASGDRLVTRVLECNGFEAGFSRAWKSTQSQGGFNITVYRFVSEAGAVSFGSVLTRSAAVRGSESFLASGAALIAYTNPDDADNFVDLVVAEVGRYLFTLRYYDRSRPEQGQVEILSNAESSRLAPIAIAA